jgi:hypothetical protein
MDKINYAEKIGNFNLITGNQNEDLAYKYLYKTEWDETKAVALYNEDSKKMIDQLTKHLQMKERKEKMKPKNIKYYQEYKIDSINNIFNKITSYFKEDNSKYFKHFSKLKNAINILDDFIYLLKKNSKTGIIIIYSSNQMRLIIDQFKTILNEPLSNELFFHNVLLYPAIDSSAEGDNFINELNCTKLPTFIVCKYKNDEALAIIGRLDIPFNLSDFRDKILESEQVYINKPQKNHHHHNNKNISSNHTKEENKNQNNENNINKNGDKYIPNIGDYDLEDEEGLDFIYNFPENNNLKMTDGQVLAFQELKLRELEKVEEKKELEERKKLEKEENYKNIINKEIEESKKIAESLRPEPDDDNPDKCVIMFRFPNGEKSIQRKFLKQDKIEILYEFIKSLGRDIFTENEHHHFSLLQSFPFKTFDDKKDKTLEEEGLFPNSVLQIKELE